MLYYSEKDYLNCLVELEKDNFNQHKNNFNYIKINKYKVNYKLNNKNKLEETKS